MAPVILAFASIAISIAIICFFVFSSPQTHARWTRTGAGLVCLAAAAGLIWAGNKAGSVLAAVAAFALLGLTGRGSVERDLNRGNTAGREDFERDARARHRHPPRQGAMTEDEAYEVLGLDAGAGPEQIRSAHRTLMKKVHPDQGGSDWLASRINQARDILMRTRR